MISGLDGLRAVAFLIVIGFHTDLLPFGWMGVQLFFVISGYLITGILIRMKEMLPAREFFLKFYTRRFLRIFPLYYFYLILLFMGSTWLLPIFNKPKIIQVILDQVAFAALYVYNFYCVSIWYQDTYFLGHLWSLSVEEQFYVFWPLLIFLIDEKYLKKAFLAGMVAGPVFRILIVWMYEARVFEMFSNPALHPVYTMPFSHIDAFAFGAYISRFSIPNARKQLLVLSVAVPLIGYAAQFAAHGVLPPLLTLGYEDSMLDSYQNIWGYSLLNYLFMVIIYCVANEKMFLRFLDWKPLQYLGKISYGLYVYHFPVIWITGQAFKQVQFGGYSTLGLATFSLLGTVVVASISYYFLEKPFLQLKDRFASYPG